MLFVKLIGGLGNQMFQYAAARGITARSGGSLWLDTCVYAGDEPDAQAWTPVYCLQLCWLRHFNIAGRVATRRQLKVAKAAVLLRGVFERDRPYNRRAWIVEPPGRERTFDPDLLRVRDCGPRWLQGYWESEKYFKDIEAIIRAEFTVKDAPNPLNAAMLARVTNCCSVALHVRRGDRTSVPAAIGVFGVLPTDYYRCAVEQLARAVVQPHFFVFSDDPRWAKAEIRLPHPTTFVDHNDDLHGYDDLRLMAGCRHHIIANSTLSWWGAWLGHNPDQIVYAPRRYYAAGVEKPMPDFYPPAWRLL